MLVGGLSFFGQLPQWGGIFVTMKDEEEDLVKQMRLGGRKAEWLE